VGHGTRRRQHLLRPGSAGRREGHRLGRSQALTTFFAFLELRHQLEIHVLTGRVVECPIDEMNKPRGRKQAALRIPQTDAEVAILAESGP
jgi:hypothetical protein